MAHTNTPGDLMQSGDQGGEEQAPQGWEPEAYRRWAQIPVDTQHLVLSHGWCPQCGQARQMDLIGGAIIADDLVLSGTCAVCGHRVARLLEGDGGPRDDRRSGAMMATNSPDAASIIAHLEALASPDDAAGMARFGIRGARVLGVPVKALRAIARETGRSHALAEALWASGIHEARILVSRRAKAGRSDPDGALGGRPRLVRSL